MRTRKGRDTSTTPYLSPCWRRGASNCFMILPFSGTKEDWEIDPRKNHARRLVAHGIKMMRGGYRLLLHYPVKADGRR